MDTNGKKEVKEFLLRERRPDPIPKRPRRNEGEKRQSSQQAKHSFSCIASRWGEREATAQTDLNPVAGFGEIMRGLQWRRIPSSHPTQLGGQWPSVP